MSLIPFISRSGRIINFDNSKAACAKFGEFLDGDRFIDPSNCTGTILGAGVDDESSLLWVRFDNEDRGRASSLNLKYVQSLKKLEKK